MFKIRRIAMHNPFARFFRARDKPNKQASPGRRLRRAGLLLRDKPCGEVRHAHFRHTGLRGLRLRARHR